MKYLNYVIASKRVVVSFLIASTIAVTGCDSNDIETIVAVETADGINGGQLYSKFWATETGFTLENSNLQSQEELDSINDHADFYRCKHCHGWDRLGQDGGYSDRAPKTTRPNVANVDLAYYSEVFTDQELFDGIKTGSVTRRDISEDLTGYDPAVDSTIGDQMPNYAQILTDDQIWDIVKYLKREALDTTQLYDITLGDGVYPERSRTFSNLGLDGDSENGDAIFAANCKGCHGDDGTGMLVDDETYTVGAHVRLKPYEDQHKVKFGHLGSTMGPILADAPLSDIQDLLKALSNESTYPDEAPAEEAVDEVVDEVVDEETATIDGAALFVANCGGCHMGNGLGSGALDITGASVSDIEEAIANVGSMAAVSVTNEEITAIASVL